MYKINRISFQNARIFLVGSLLLFGVFVKAQDFPKDVSLLYISTNQDDPKEFLFGNDRKLLGIIKDTTEVGKFYLQKSVTSIPLQLKEGRLSFSASCHQSLALCLNPVKYKEKKIDLSLALKNEKGSSSISIDIDDVVKKLKGTDKDTLLIINLTAYLIEHYTEEGKPRQCCPPQPKEDPYSLAIEKVCQVMQIRKGLSIELEGKSPIVNDPLISNRRNQIQWELNAEFRKLNPSKYIHVKELRRGKKEPEEIWSEKARSYKGMVEDKSEIIIKFDLEQLRRDIKFEGNLSLRAEINNEPIEIPGYSEVGQDYATVGVSSSSPYGFSLTFLSLLKKVHDLNERTEFEDCQSDLDKDKFQELYDAETSFDDLKNRITQYLDLIEEKKQGTKNDTLKKEDSVRLIKIFEAELDSIGISEYLESNKDGTVLISELISKAKENQFKNILTSQYRLLYEVDKEKGIDTAKFRDEVLHKLNNKNPLDLDIEKYIKYLNEGGKISQDAIRKLTDDSISSFLNSFNEKDTSSVRSDFSKLRNIWNDLPFYAKPTFKEKLKNDAFVKSFSSVLAAIDEPLDALRKKIKDIDKEDITAIIETKGVILFLKGLQGEGEDKPKFDETTYAPIKDELSRLFTLAEKDFILKNIEGSFQEDYENLFTIEQIKGYISDTEKSKLSNDAIIKTINEYIECLSLASINLEEITDYFQKFRRSDAHTQNALMTALQRDTLYLNHGLAFAQATSIQVNEVLIQFQALKTELSTTSVDSIPLRYRLSSLHGDSERALRMFTTIVRDMNGLYEDQLAQAKSNVARASVFYDEESPAFLDEWANYVAQLAASEIYKKLYPAKIDLSLHEIKDGSILELYVVVHDSRSDKPRQNLISSFEIKNMGWQVSVSESILLIDRINEENAVASNISRSNFEPIGGASLLWTYNGRIKKTKNGYYRDVVGGFIASLKPSIGINVSYPDFIQNKFEVGAGPIIGLFENKVFFNWGYNFNTQGVAPTYLGVGFSFSNIFDKKNQNEKGE